MKKNEIKETVINAIITAPEVSAKDIALKLGVSASTVYKYKKEMEATIQTAKPAEAEASAEPVKAQYSTKEQKGYSLSQMRFVYAKCKEHKLYIHPVVLKKMYEWADKLNFTETEPEMEELRVAACKLIKCCSCQNFEIAQKKANFIQSRLVSKAA